MVSWRPKRRDYLGIGLSVLVVIGVWTFSYFLENLANDQSIKPLEIMQRTWGVPHGLKPGEVRNFGSIQFVWCPPGEVEIGSRLTPKEVTALVSADANNPSQFDGEHPPRRETLKNGFWLGRYEITRKQWRDVMHTDPWSDDTSGGEVHGDDFPATHVNWEDIRKFIEAFRHKEGYFVTLPMEELWEYACKAGSDSIFSFGNEVERLGEYAWYNGNMNSVSTISVHPVGQKSPNAWGLYDMHGNAMEVTRSRFDQNFTPIPYREEVQGNFYVVVRGGSASMPPTYIRSAQRFTTPHDTRDDATGFRVILLPD